MPFPTDAPPSYHAIPTNQGHQPDNKLHIPTPLVSPSQTFASSKIDKGKSRSSNSWLESASSLRRSCEIRNTIQGLLRDLVQDNISSSPAANHILVSCADACAAHGISFSDLLQQRYIEQRTLLYWVVVKRSPNNRPEIEENQDPDLLTALLSYASPLRQETITDLRQACIAISDQNLFKRLGQLPGFAQMSPVDKMLLGETPPDDIKVVESSAAPDAFVVEFVIPQFHKRMAVSKQILLEFIARGRLWCFQFFSDPWGLWDISVSLRQSSSPTHFNSRLLILEAAPSFVGVSQPDTPSPATPGPSSLGLSFRKESKSKALIVPLQVSQQPLLGTSVWTLRDDATKLQYTNNPYIGADEMLRARLEARLVKTTSEEAFAVF